MDELRETCTCQNLCAFPGITKIAVSFESMTETERSSTVKAMLLSLTALYATDVTWTKWKDVLNYAFNIPKHFRISGYHIFRYSANNPATLYAKELTTTEHWKEFSLLKKNVTCYRCGVDIRRKLKNANYKADWPKLEDVHSAKESNRKHYLEKLVCQRYFGSDPEFPGKYFGCGKQ